MGRHQKKKKDKKVRNEKLKLLNKIRQQLRELSDSGSDTSSSNDDSSPSEGDSSEVEMELHPPQGTAMPGDQNDIPTMDTPHEVGQEVLSILGSDPHQNERYGPEIHTEIASRWTSFLREGIDKDQKKIITEKYPIIDNCRALAGPQLNAEVRTCIGESILRQDQFLTRLQSELGAGVTALAQPLNKLFSTPTEETNPLLLNMVEAAKLFTNVHHSLSMHRRYLLLPNLNSGLRKTLEEFPIEEELFGQQFSEKLKKTSELKKASWELKIPKQTGSKVKPHTTYPKNFKRQNRPKHKMKRKEDKNRFSSHNRNAHSGIQQRREEKRYYHR